MFAGQTWNLLRTVATVTPAAASSTPVRFYSSAKRLKFDLFGYPKSPQVITAPYMDILLDRSRPLPTTPASPPRCTKNLMLNTRFIVALEERQKINFCMAQAMAAARAASPDLASPAAAADSPAPESPPSPAPAPAFRKSKKSALTDAFLAAPVK